MVLTVISKRIHSLYKNFPGCWAVVQSRSQNCQTFGPAAAAVIFSDDADNVSIILFREAVPLY